MAPPQISRVTWSNPFPCCHQINTPGFAGILVPKSVSLHCLPPPSPGEKELWLDSSGAPPRYTTGCSGQNGSSTVGRPHTTHPPHDRHARTRATCVYMHPHTCAHNAHPHPHVCRHSTHPHLCVHTPHNTHTHMCTHTTHPPTYVCIPHTHTTRHTPYTSHTCSTLTPFPTHSLAPPRSTHLRKAGVRAAHPLSRTSSFTPGSASPLPCPPYPPLSRCSCFLGKTGHLT